MSPKSRLYPFLLACCLILIVACLALSSAAQATLSADHKNVPATARQAAQMSQFASRLHPTATPLRSTPVPRAHQRQGAIWPQDEIAYDNGPVNGNVDAWTINFGYAVTNSAQINTQINGLSGITFWAWLIPGDTITNVEVSIGVAPFGSEAFDGFVNLTSSNCFSNSFGYNVCEESGNYSGPNTNGNLWVTLQNANVPSGDPVYWDENSGVGCSSPGCPSLAQESVLGTIPSESFDILANVGTTCASNLPNEPTIHPAIERANPAPTFKVLYNFSGGVDGGEPNNALSMDARGNLYGTTWLGGSDGSGTLFKLTATNSGWRFNRIYSFSGPDGNGPSSLAVAADGTVYGATSSGGCCSGGVLFALSPPASIPTTVFTDWLERLLYSFTASDDGSDPTGSIVLDSNHVYGTANRAGANGRGTVYEFTNGALQVLHAFGGYPGDGGYPSSGVIKGIGGLYGTTEIGGSSGVGTVFTLAGGYQVLYNFTGETDGAIPISLAADQAGNLYGATTAVFPWLRRRRHQCSRSPIPTGTSERCRAGRALAILCKPGLRLTLPAISTSRRRITERSATAASSRAHAAGALPRYMISTAQMVRGRRVRRSSMPKAISTA